MEEKKNGIITFSFTKQNADLIHFYFVYNINFVNIYTYLYNLFIMTFLLCCLFINHLQCFC